MLEVLADLNRLLATSPAFLLGPWLAAARSVATNDQVGGQLPSTWPVGCQQKLCVARTPLCTSSTLGTS